MATMGRGYNSFHGFDQGPPPPNMGSPQPFSQMPGFQGFPAFPPMFPPPMGMPMGMGMPMPMPMPMFPLPFGGFPGYPGLGQSFPSIPPHTDGGIPGIHLRNSTGGVGLPPGYNYTFPQEHCKIHLFKTGATPPWQGHVSAWDPRTHSKLLVPCNTTVKELMINVGCTNADPKKNKLHEVQEAGNGKWVKGITISGDDKDKVKKLITDFGWDKTRTGGPGERPVVWLYCTKD